MPSVMEENSYTQADLEESVEVVIAGYQKKNKIMTDKERTIFSTTRSSMHLVAHCRAIPPGFEDHHIPSYVRRPLLYDAGG